jgi:hypothetical protein
MGSFEARKSRASKLPIAPGRSQWTLKLTVLDDEVNITGPRLLAENVLHGPRKVKPRHGLSLNSGRACRGSGETRGDGIPQGLGGKIRIVGARPLRLSILAQGLEVLQP